MQLFVFSLLFIALLSCQKDQRGLIVGKIKKSSKLATTEYTIDKIVYGIKRKKLAWVVNLNQARFLARSKAIVKAGVNLEKLRMEDVHIEGKRISLTLPPVEVINFSYPAEDFSMDTHIARNAFMNKISLEDQEQFFQDAETDIRNSLKYMNIVETTQKKTRLLIENVLSVLGYEEIYIDFHTGELIPEIKPDLEE